jgi:glycyl-tRNA synthetase
VSFSRPVRWIVAVYGDRIIPFEFAGVASGSTSRGLRPDDSPPVEIRSAAQYEDEMERAGILLDSGSRKESVRTQVGRAASQAGGEALMDEALLAEVVNLVEKPTALLGNYNPDFLRLPKDVLITVMKKHQRYFPIEREGKLLPNFVAIRNGDGQHLDIVQQGNEHVLGARFADADFFVREDLKQPLKAYRPELAGLMFHAKLGSMLEKSRRMEKLASALSTMMGVPKEEAATALRATTLSKADLVTQMVTEMTSLQGVIGREYALRSGEEPAVATAIGEQYEPIPSSNAGLIVALADRLDSLVGLFAIGLAPTSAKDPFGLRRAALGVVEPLIHHDVHLDLAKAVERAGKLQPVKPSAKRISEILEFLAVRLAVLLKEAGYRYDVVEAVIAEQSTDPAGAKSAVEQLQSLTAREDWKIILPAFARCVRITRDQKNQLVLKPKALKEKEEKALYRELHKAQAALRRAGRPDPDAFVHAFAPMIPSIDTFFDKVLVMAKTRAVRENRLALLQGVAGLATGVADFSKLEGF